MVRATQNDLVARGALQRPDHRAGRRPEDGARVGGRQLSAADGLDRRERQRATSHPPREAAGGVAVVRAHAADHGQVELATMVREVVTHAVAGDLPAERAGDHGAAHLVLEVVRRPAALPQPGAQTGLGGEALPTTERGGRVADFSVGGLDPSRVDGLADQAAVDQALEQPRVVPQPVEVAHDRLHVQREPVDSQQIALARVVRVAQGPGQGAVRRQRQGQRPGAGQSQQRVVVNAAQVALRLPDQRRIERTMTSRQWAEAGGRVARSRAGATEIKEVAKRVRQCRVDSRGQRAR